MKGQKPRKSSSSRFRNYTYSRIITHMFKYEHERHILTAHSHVAFKIIQFKIHLNALTHTTTYTLLIYTTKRTDKYRLADNISYKHFTHHNHSHPHSPSMPMPPLLATAYPSPVPIIPRNCSCGAHSSSGCCLWMARHRLVYSGGLAGCRGSGFVCKCVWRGEEREVG